MISPEAAPSSDSRLRPAQLLLAARMSGGWWEGELSSSALSTATAVFAIHLHQATLAESPQSIQRSMELTLVERGIRWLIDHQNEDGGWGDTIYSISNISTTALCWAALSVDPGGAAAAIENAERWLTQAAGALEPAALATAIKGRYGKDRTFSVPILTMCALAGRLGAGREAWRLIPQLPFELAACPYQWFQWLRLPVVSYALPALISMGLARHAHRPTLNPLLRSARTRVSERTLAVLKRIQPEGGGFLEATPLTSFVVMSLIGAGLPAGPVVSNGVDFLIRSVRADGSWPIDTNLATWVTTLSVNALLWHPDSKAGALLTDSDRRDIVQWLLAQQHRVEHPYTHAAPGGWAWTDLDGGVPDADDTAGALIALHRLGERRVEVVEAVRLGMGWLLDLQNRDGGVPTFCRGWGALPFDRGGADLTAHALRAWSIWRKELPELRKRIDIAGRRAVDFLARVQRPDGAWQPLWFGNQFAPDDVNLTYGTARVLSALNEVEPWHLPPSLAMRESGLRWLLAAQNSDGSWGGARGIAGTLEETSLAIAALGGTPGNIRRECADAISRGRTWLDQATRDGEHFAPSPIGFYFAKLWYCESLYPLVFCTAAAQA